MVFPLMSGHGALANGSGLSNFQGDSSTAKSTEHVTLSVLTTNARPFNQSCGMNRFSQTLQRIAGQQRASGSARSGLQASIPMWVADIQTIRWLKSHSPG